MGLEHVGRFLAPLCSKIEPHIQMRWYYFVYSRSDLETVGIFLLLKSCAHGSCMQLPQMSTTNGTTKFLHSAGQEAHGGGGLSCNTFWCWDLWSHCSFEEIGWTAGGDFWSWGGGMIGEGQVGNRMFYLSNPVMHASDELLPPLFFLLPWQMTKHLLLQHGLWLGTLIYSNILSNTVS